MNMTPSGNSSALAKALERPIGDTKGINGANIFQNSYQNSYQKVSSISTSGIHNQQSVSVLLPSSVSNPSSNNASQVVGSSTTDVTATNSTAIQMIPNG